MSFSNKWSYNMNICLCHMCIISDGQLGVESVICRVEKRTKKNTLLPEWSFGDVQKRSLFIAKIVLNKFIYVILKFFISAVDKSLWRIFLSYRSGCILSLYKSCYLLLQVICCPQNASMFTSAKAQIENWIDTLGWLCFDLYLVTCCYHVWHLIILYLGMLQSLALYKGSLILKSVIKQEVLGLCC